MKLKYTKKNLALYSLVISLALTAPATIFRILFDSYGMLTSLVRWFTFAIFSAIWVFLIWLYTRWVASTAEKAGRSYVGFMLIAILFTPIAWIIVLLFKKPETPSA